MNFKLNPYVHSTQVPKGFTLIPAVFGIRGWCKIGLEFCYAKTFLEHKSQIFSTCYLPIWNMIIIRIYMQLDNKQPGQQFKRIDWYAAKIDTFEIKIENGNVKWVKITTTLPESRKQINATNGSSAQLENDF